jgi:hypothetical protein
MSPVRFLEKTTLPAPIIATLITSILLLTDRSRRYRAAAHEEIPQPARRGLASAHKKSPVMAITGPLATIPAKLTEPVRFAFA